MLGGDLIDTLSGTGTQLTGDTRPLLRAAQRRAPRDRHVTDHSDRTTYVFGSKGAPRCILANDRYLDPARGTSGLCSNDAQARLAASHEGENVSGAHLGQHTSRLLACFVLARPSPRLLRLTELVAQSQILAHITVRTRQVFHRCLPLHLELVQPRCQRDDGRVRLVLRE